MRFASRSIVCLLRPATLVVLAVSGCSESPIRLPTAPVPQAPSVRTPGGALRFLEWSWNRRDIARYTEIVADDFRFMFSALDPYGDTYRDSPWTREDEIASIGHLFQVATSITLALDRNFIVAADPRPGKDPTWHRKVRSGLSLVMIDGNQEQTVVTGHADFYMVRGDSAAIPEALAARGFRPDSTRWYLQRWDDFTGPGDGIRATPAKNSTMGSLRALYR